MDWLDATVTELRTRLESIADPVQSEAMAAYMKNRVPFLGVQAAARRQVQRPVIAASAELDEAQLMALAERCWNEREREFHYVATDLLRKRASTLTPASLGRVERLIRTHAWWDTVDALAAWTVGPLVLAHPELGATMDEWLGGEVEPDGSDMWIARTSILHQLSFRDQTDANRLFTATIVRAADREFFIRKAIGWALRQYARIEPDAVRRHVAEHTDRLSPLSRREALKRL